jgi:hypothetical protein
MSPNAFSSLPECEIFFQKTAAYVFEEKTKKAKLSLGREQTLKKSKEVESSHIVLLLLKLKEHL